MNVNIRMQPHLFATCDLSVFCGLQTILQWPPAAKNGTTISMTGPEIEQQKSPWL